MTPFLCTMPSLLCINHKVVLLSPFLLCNYEVKRPVIQGFVIGASGDFLTILLANTGATFRPLPRYIIVALSFTADRK